MAAPISLGSLIGLIVGVAAVTVVYRRERAGDRLTAMHLLLGITLADAALFPTAGTENGIFLTGFGSFRDSLALYLVPVLLVVRLLSGPPRPRYTAPGLAWLAFFAWVVAEAVAGYAARNDQLAVHNQIKVLIFLGGTALLAAGVPADQWIGRRGIPLMVAVAAPVAVILILTKVSNATTNGTVIPHLVHGANTGKMGADCATLFVSLGLLGLGLALSSPTRRRGALPAILLLTAPAFTGQRASLIGMGLGVALLGAVALSRSGRSIFTVLPRERGALLIVLMLAFAGVAAASVAGYRYNPANSSVAHSFTSQGKQNSAQARINQWHVAEGLIKQKPVLGHGLGVEYEYVEDIKGASSELVRSDLTHDIFLDTLLRTGIVGCGLLVVALVLSLAQGLRLLRGPAPVQLAGLGVAVTAALAGLLARAAVESLFEKQRLCVALGLVLGVGSSAWHARAAAAAPLGVARDRLLAASPDRTVLRLQPGGHSRALPSITS